MATLKAKALGFLALSWSQPIIDSEINLTPAIHHEIPATEPVIDIPAIIAEESKRNHVDQSLVEAIIKIESDFNPKAISDRGALGLMQIKPSTAKWLSEKEGIEWCNLIEPACNIKFGVRYFARLKKAYGNIDTALIAYNIGPGRVNQMIEANELVDNGYAEKIHNLIDN